MPDEDVLRRRLTCLMDQTGHPVLAAVHAAPDGEEVFAEEQFFTLLDALGIPALSDAEPGTS